MLLGYIYKICDYPQNICELEREKIFMNFRKSYIK